jgi:GyrI-like small molecule binding domain
MSEQPAPEAVSYVQDREPQPVLSIRRNVAVAELADAQAESLGALWRSLHGRGLLPLGPPFVRYHLFGETETDVEVGVPVADGVTGEPPVEAGVLPEGEAITTWHLGPHEGLGDAYSRLTAWLNEHGREPAGAAWEVYWWIDASRKPDPSGWPLPTEWRTELVQPVAATE